MVVGERIARPDISQHNVHGRAVSVWPLNRMRWRLLASLALSTAAALLLVGALACDDGPRGEKALLVFAATSLTDALTEIGRSFEEQRDVDVAFSYEGSQTLARQIVRGAPADMFISAGRFPADLLQDEGLVEHEATHLLTNRLVLVIDPSGADVESLDQLTSDLVRRVAVANPDLAPAGWYAREALTHLGLWENLRGKLVLGPDVRVTLAYVESGNVDVALVYQTDARVAEGLKVLDIVPPDSYSPIVYPAVVIRRSENKALAAEFLDFLASEAAESVFRKHGFEPLKPGK